MTKKPISTISFNSGEFLGMKCKELVKDDLIQSYMYIKHYAEEDTKKDHYHLYLIPSKPVDPQKVRLRFREPSLTGAADLGCLPFQPSKVGDWLLYSLHYPPYLLRKGLSRINTYNLSDIVSNEPREWLDQLFHDSAETVVDTRVDLFLERMRNGDTFGDILASGLVPPSQVVFYDKLFRLNARALGANLDDDGQTQLQKGGVPF